MRRRQRGARRRRERRRRERRFSGSLGSANRQSRQQGGGAERAGTLFADAGRSVEPRGALKPGSALPAPFHGEKERLNRNSNTDSRSWFNSQRPHDVLPQNAITEPREVRVSHLTRPTEIQNSLALAKTAADRAIPCRKSEISQQQNGDGGVSTQIGHAPVRLEAQGQTAVQCRQTRFRRSRRTVAGQF